MFIRPPQAVGKLVGADTSSWVVVHDAWRDQYQLPAAFAEAGLLTRFVTDWYTPTDRPVWSWAMKAPVVSKLLGLQTRFSSRVPSALVADHKARFLAGLLRRRWTGEGFNDVVEGEKSGRRAAAYANGAGAHVLAASYSAAAAFQDLRPGLARVLFQVHPQPRFLRSLYSEYLGRDADYAGLAEEPEHAITEAGLKNWEREADLADHILCASSFTKRSLIWSGVAAERISVIPYGVDATRFKPGPASEPASSGGPFKVLFVGQRVARKGLGALLRVWGKLKPENAELILVGGHQASERTLSGYRGLYTDVRRVGPSTLVELYQQADALVLPSLAEGFGHVYLEALACGTPVLCTENTGAADLVTSGENGWILPAGDADALESQLAWMLKNRERVRAMRLAARALAERHTWERFRQSVRETAATVAASKTNASKSQATTKLFPETTAQEVTA